MSVDIVTGGAYLSPPDPTTLISLADLKAHCRIDVATDDTLLAGYFLAAIAIVESEVQRALLPRTYQWTRQTLDSCGMILPLAPVVQVRSISYLPYPDGVGGPVTLDPSLYFLGRRGPASTIERSFRATVWPSVGRGAAPVTIVFDAGAVALVSDNVKHALKMIVADLYEYRTPAVLSSGQFQLSKLGAGVQTTVMALLAPERW